MGTMEATEDRTVQKDMAFEIMRVLAIFFVIFNHTGNRGYLLFFQREPGSIQFWFYLFASIFCKFSVPLFFMISGALMLGKEEAFAKTVRRIGRFLIIMIGISFMYYLFDVITSGEQASLPEFLKLLYTSSVSTHLWYLYAYVGYLLVLPVLRAAVRSLEEKYYIFLFGLCIVYNGIIPSMEFLAFKGAVHITGEFDIGWLFSRCVFYPLIGYYVNNKMQIEKVKGKMGLLIGTDIVCMGISAVMDYQKMKVMGKYTEMYPFHVSFLALHAVVIFIVIKYWMAHHSIAGKLQKVILSAGASSFGIYLIHVFFLRMAWFGKFVDRLCKIGINGLFSCCVGCAAVFGISWLCIVVVKKVPLLNKLV